jgi:hypothetical protein
LNTNNISVGVFNEEDAFNKRGVGVFDIFDGGFMYYNINILIIIKYKC